MLKITPNGRVNLEISTGNYFELKGLISDVVQNQAYKTELGATDYFILVDLYRRLFSSDIAKQKITLTKAEATAIHTLYTYHNYLPYYIGLIHQNLIA